MYDSLAVTIYTDSDLACACHLRIIYSFLCALAYPYSYASLSTIELLFEFWTYLVNSLANFIVSMVKLWLNVIATENKLFLFVLPCAQ